MQGLSASEIAQHAGIADDYRVDAGKLMEAYTAAQAFEQEVRRLFAERRCSWPRVTLILGEYGGILHYDDPEQDSRQGRHPWVRGDAPRSGQAQVGWLDAQVAGEMPAIPALPVCPEMASVKPGGDAA